MLHGHVHNTRENTFLLRWREEIRNACTERHHVRGQFINVGCMMPWMDYQPRTLAEIMGVEELDAQLQKHSNYYDKNILYGIGKK